MSVIKFIHFSTLAKFQEYLNAGKINPEQIAFIQDSNYIWTHNNFYKCISDNFEDDKQDTLISGVNIKTINGTSILGEGDI